MSVLAHTNNPVLNPDKNAILRNFLKKTFYAQFCAGENAAQVRHAVASLRNIGFSGVILGYAKEVVLTDDESKGLTSGGGVAVEETSRAEIDAWATGTLETILLAAPGDFVALKFTGAGRGALYNLTHRLPPSGALARAIDSMCNLAASRDVRLLFDAEQQSVQAAIDEWTIDYMRKYNRAGEATVYGTYQAYLKSTPATVSEHLSLAQKDGFTLGVKLVRGAYLGSDPRHLIHDTKEHTDAAYDGITEALLRRRWMAPLTPPPSASTFPNVNMVLATHNRESVLKARNMVNGGERGTDVVFAQLQGMADDVSCELLSPARRGGDIRVYKYSVWGSTGECMKYLLRRAHENRDAVQRTRSGRDAMRSELWRRVKRVFGMGA